MNRSEKICFALLALSFIIGIWHGFPFTNVVADEMYFSGSVLRAMESHTILPQGLDVPYGTVTYYLSYILILAGLSVFSVFFLFDFDVLKLFIIQNTHIVYAFSRMLSLLCAFFALWGFYFVSKKYVSDHRVRILIGFVLFSNILVNVIFHTSKVWVLSTVLMVSSIYFLNRSLEESDWQKGKRSALISIFAAFLSVANFPLMGMNLLCIPVLLYFYWPDKDKILWLAKVSACGAVLAAIIILSNYHGIEAQVKSIIFDYTIAGDSAGFNLSLLDSSFLHLKKIVLMFPLVLAVILYAILFGKIKNKKLFWIGILYSALFIGFLIIIDRWSTFDKSSLRYFFPMPFLLSFVLLSFEIPFRKLLWVIPALSVIYLLPTLYYLAIPTTSHDAVAYVDRMFADDPSVAIYNHIGADTPLTENKNSYLLNKKSECGSKCEATIKYDLDNWFKAIVLDDHSEPQKAAEILNRGNAYHLTRSISTSTKYTLVTSFTNPVLDDNYYSADNSGSYFDVAYFHLKKYGPNIYLYKENTPYKPQK